MAIISADYATEQVLLDSDELETQLLARLCNRAVNRPGGKVDEGWRESAIALERALAMVERGEGGTAGGDSEWHTRVIGEQISTDMDPWVAEELASEIDGAIARGEMAYDTWGPIARRLDEAVKELARSSDE